MTTLTDDRWTLDRILNRLGWMTDKATVVDGRLEGSFRSEDLGCEGRDCEDCEDECYCEEGDRWDAELDRVHADAHLVLTRQFPGAVIGVTYSEKGWFEVAITPRAVVTVPRAKTRTAKKAVTGRAVGKLAHTLRCRSCGVATGRCTSSTTGLPTQTHRARMVAARAILTA